MNKDNSDKDILDTMLGGITVRDMTPMTFLGWMADKLNGVSAYKAANQELIGMVANPPISRLMPDAEKCRIIRRLMELDVQII